MSCTHCGVGCPWPQATCPPSDPCRPWDLSLPFLECQTLEPQNTRQKGPAMIQPCGFQTVPWSPRGDLLTLNLSIPLSSLVLHYNILFKRVTSFKNMFANLQFSLRGVLRFRVAERSGLEKKKNGQVFPPSLPVTLGRSRSSETSSPLLQNGSHKD